MFRQTTHTNLTSAKSFLQDNSHYFNHPATTRQEKTRERGDCMFRLTLLLSLHRAQLQEMETPPENKTSSTWLEVPGYVTTLFTGYCAEREI